VNSARRRKARELLVQALYAHRIGGIDLATAVDDQVERRRPHPESLEYVRELQPTLEERLEEIDGLVDRHLQTRAPDRVGPVERAILEIGTAELLGREDVPTAVIIDESTHLVRTFGEEDAVGFVHAILDRLGRELRGRSAGDIGG
jgi:transcription antitermination factor NusB